MSSTTGSKNTSNKDNHNDKDKAESKKSDHEKKTEFPDKSSQSDAQEQVKRLGDIMRQQTQDDLRKVRESERKGGPDSDAKGAENGDLSKSP